MSFHMHVTTEKALCYTSSVWSTINILIDSYILKLHSNISGSFGLFFSHGRQNSKLKAAVEYVMSYKHVLASLKRGLVGLFLY